MLTLIESISLAGDRNKQNDDACGFTGPRAWVIDGATDLSDTPLSKRASDASWLAQYLNRRLYEPFGNDWAGSLRELSRQAGESFHMTVKQPYERWQSPIASMLMVVDRGPRLHGVELGDCRLFALDADGGAYAKGGPEGAREAEAAAAATQTDTHKPLLERTETLDRLRRSRAAINQPGAEWTFGLDPLCADHARGWFIDLKLPAYLLLMTDGFAVLADRYGAYDPAGLIRAALERGLQELARELRAIEAADAGGAKHPRFKASDDATALLMRLT